MSIQTLKKDNMKPRSRKSVNAVAVNLGSLNIAASSDDEMAPEVIETYRELNDKCDVVIKKIKNRKQKAQ